MNAESNNRQLKEAQIGEVNDPEVTERNCIQLSPEHGPLLLDLSKCKQKPDNTDQFLEEVEMKLINGEDKDDS